MSQPANQETVLISRGGLWRRQFIAFLAGGGLGGIGVLAYERDGESGGTTNVTASGSNGARENPRVDYEQTFGSRMVDRITFSDNGVMSVHLPRDHGTATFGVWHAVDDINNQKPIATYGGLKAGGSVNEPVPRYDGMITIPIIDAIRRSNISFPSRRFRLVGFSGSTFDLDKVDDVVFTVPSTLMP